jgi:uncharacterized membrane protein (DUF485 family)
MRGTESLAALDAARWRIALTLTAVAIAIYFGFILLVAFNKPLLGRQVTSGLSIGILLGSLVIAASWVLIWIYGRWANRYYDEAIARLRSGPPA